jgi:hypothetical protein
MTPDRDLPSQSGLAVFADFSLLFARAAPWGFVASFAAGALVLLAA